MNTDTNGNDLADQGHFPYGETWYMGSRGTKWQFTTYERDLESGNDYAQARSYVNRLARFSSLDPLAGDTSDPQTLNRYSYVRNMPIMAVDPSGMDDCDDSDVAARRRTGHGRSTRWAADDCDDGGDGGGGGGDSGGTIFIGGGYLGPGAYIDGGYVGDVSGLFGNGESTVQCPNNVCAGIGINAQGQVAWVQFYAFAGGINGYYDPTQLTDGIYDYNGKLYNSANFQALLQQQYSDQISSQCGTVTTNLSKDAPAGSGAYVMSCNADVQGGNANFQINCGTWDCAGRWGAGCTSKGTQ